MMAVINLNTLTGYSVSRDSVKHPL